MSALTNHEKYLAGEPLTEELEALKRGETPAEAVMQPEGLTGQGSAVDIARAISREDRIALREMRQGAGWPVLQRILQKIVYSEEQMTITISQEDPLGNKEEIANHWAYVALFKRMLAKMNFAVELELKKDVWDKEQRG